MYFRHLKALLLCCLSVGALILTLRIIGEFVPGPTTKKIMEMRDLEFEDWEVRKPAQDDSYFVYFVRSNYLYPPRYDQPYRLTPDDIISKEYPSEHGQVKAILPFLNAIKNGFFLEAGAHDGVHLSNTLWLEIQMGWSGLLIEGDPQTYLKLRRKQRRAWTSPACLSPRPFPMTLNWYKNPVQSGINGLTFRTYHPITEMTKIRCIPLYTLLLSLGRSSIDYFSLDLEGSELDILNTIPFNKIEFKILTIEHVHIQSKVGRGKDAVIKFMKSKGYIYYGSVSEDVIFLHSSMKRFIPSDWRLQI